ncbi:MAG: hypothetical protein ACM369_03760 [Acidobacteriota bacterium]
MFRIARAFLIVAPAAFVLVLVAFLVAHPRAVDSFVPYPMLADALGGAVSRRPFVRFIAASIAFFIPLYLMSGILLFFADAGVSAAAPLWSRSRGRRADAVPPESRWAFLAVTALAALVLGVSLHRVAHGGDLPGGINIGPLLVALAAFASLISGLVVGGVVAVPRALIGRLRTTA